ncbi:Hint domain-containing protein [Pseudoalteromonas aurantia]|uniref:Hint domain-containing protein n=1 Tax=Pseudoalteromonas aurantia TaxID=43654 RepID=A0A5S3V9I1_9GAMM|nr:Hint domain-containing protein [Pseudoalteromonas aurantia]TMO64176.1 hypothetical protein CWC18_07040 [Pseudoalteromonas aurantia]TMO68544.1 hypothetical protein CWC19_09010 [Pseudoalteromonas aurantia]TMO75166.1 hypothetical protein CWC20_08560 [Pseudoalteromonas aurantia]
MKVLSLSIALALGCASISAYATQSELSTQTAAPFNIAQGFEKANLTDKTKNQALKDRLNKYGLNKQNRPHLFSLINKQLENGHQVDASLNQKMIGGNSASCDAHHTSLCTFFKHMGYEVLNWPGTNDQYLVVSALNSEITTTDYTFIDITLVDEKGSSITLPRYAEFFGDGSEKKRKSIYSAAKVADVLAKLKTAERVYADAWVTVVTTDANGNEVVEDRNSKVEYSKEAILAELGYVAPEFAAKSDTDMSITADIGILNGNTATIIHPKDVRSKAGATTPDQKIIVCLNRNYGDCDYENIYPTNTPNDQLKLKIPFVGEYVMRGKVTRIYRPDWTVLNVQDNGDGTIKLVDGGQVEKPGTADFGTNIFVQTKEGGGASTISGHQYTDIQNFFADNLNVEYIGTGRRIMTKISWNIPRNQGVFGDASLYGRYQDANWIMNLALDNELRASQGARPEVHVIGSSGLNSSWDKTDYPQMQIVYSCLAEGSLITLPGGKQLPIEMLQVGDTVVGASQFNPAQRLDLEIADISIGVEAIPMIQLTTREGKKLLLTESHPVITQSGQSVWAKDLELGERIHTKGKTEFITKIDEVKFDGKVYNLRLKRNKHDDIQIEGETFSMFANGIQVGDLGMQSDNEFKNEVETQQDVLNRLPEPWHKDYLNSIR